MREIKFRAFSKIFNEHEMFYDVEIILKDDGTWFRFNDKKRLYQSGDRCIIMQYTGLKDKNGKEIYEGDILREPPTDDWDKINYSCFEVFFHDGDAHLDYNIGYTMNRMYNHGSVCGGYIPAFKPKKVSQMIIIGNVHQNPELLKP